MILFYKGKYSVANKNKPFLFFWFKGYYLYYDDEP